jgi:outer membrane protein OmpA-like peptidoglycan-associated protein
MVFRSTTNLIYAALNSFFPLFTICVVSVFCLAGCAASNVSREAAANVDLGVQNAKNLGESDTNIADAYQNSSQAVKGAMLGGAAGAITGALSSSVGVIPGTAIGAILGASYGSYIDANTTLADRLENRGVNVIELGDQILIVIPSARLFNDTTSTIKPQAYSTLNLVAQYINSFAKILVKVSAYTADTGVCSVDLSLSKQQAAKVAKALLAQGVDARILYAEGYGGTHLVTKNSFDWDGNDNYRIEITLEKLYV